MFDIRFLIKSLDNIHIAIFKSKCKYSKALNCKEIGSEYEFLRRDAKTIIDEASDKLSDIINQLEEYEIEKESKSK